MQESPVIERAGGGAPGRRRRGQWLLVAGFVVLASLIAGLAYWAWAQQAGSLRDQAERGVNAVAELKAAQIAAWQEERHGDAELIRTNRLLAATVTDLLAGRDVAASTARVRSNLGGLPHYYKYADVILFAPGGRVIMRVPAAAMPTPGPRVRALLAEAQRTRQVVSSDLYRGPDGAARIEMVAPVLAQRPSDPPVASVVLHIDPARFLYPFIQEWPLPNATGETLLVERQSDRVLFLNELRFRKGTALQLSSPAADQTLPAAMAVRGRRGIVEGLDYRDVPVMAALAPVTGTDWYVVARARQVAPSQRETVASCLESDLRMNERPSPASTPPGSTPSGRTRPARSTSATTVPGSPCATLPMQRLLRARGNVAPFIIEPPRL